MKLFNYGLLILLGSSFGLFGCTRAKKENHSSFTISLPQISQKSSALNDIFLSHVILNISKDDGTVYSKSWDACYYCKTRGSIDPTSLTVEEIPYGSRTVQILAVYENDPEGKFFFGSSSVEFNKPEVTSSITIAPIGSKDMMEGQINGRYLTSSNNGPTGDVEILLNPKGSKTPMLLMTAPMANGWFNFFIFSEVSFSYRIKDKLTGVVTPLFTNVNLDSDVFKPGSSKPLARVSVPQHIRTRYGENNSQTPEDADAEALVVGWFGNTEFIADKKVCYPTTREDIQGRFRKSNSTLALAWDPTISTQANAVTVQGGRGFTSTPPTECAAGTRNLTSLYFDAKRMDRAHEGFAGFEGSFVAQRPNEYDTMATSTVTGSSVKTVSLSMKLLPGITTSMYKGFYFYKTTDEFEWPGGGLPCEEIAAGAADSSKRIGGYEKIGEAPMPTPASSPLVFSFQSTEQAVNSVAVCPYGDKGHFSAGVQLRRHALFPNEGSGGGGGGGGSPNGGPPAKLRITKNYPRNVHTGCDTFTARLEDSNGIPTINSTTAPITFQLSAAGAPVTGFTMGTNCGGSPVPLSIPMGQGELYFEAAMATSATVVLSASNITGNLAAINPTLEYRDPNDPANHRALATGPMGFSVDQCAPVIVRIVDYNQNLVTPPSSVDLAITLSAPNAVKAYSNPACNGSEISAVSFLASQPAEKVIYLKILQVTQTSEVTFHRMSPVVDMGGISIFGSMVPTGNASYSTVTGFLINPGFLKQDFCHAVIVQPFHDGSAPPGMPDKYVVPAPTAISNINFSVVGGSTGTFSTSPGCSSPGPVSFAAGSTSLLIYFKPTSTTTADSKIRATSSSPSYTTDASYTVNDTFATKVVLEIGDTKLKEGGICIPLLLSPKDDAGNLRPVLNSGINVLLDNTGAGEFYQNIACTDLLPGRLFVNLKTQSVVYYKTPTTISTTVDITGAFDGGTSLPIVPILALPESLDSSADSITILPMGKMYANNCYPLYVKGTRSGATFTVASGTLTLPSSGTISYYDSEDRFCEGSPITSTSFSNAGSTMVRVKATTAQNLTTQNFSSTSGFTASGQASLTFLDSGAPASLRLSTVGNTFVNQTCWPIHIAVEAGPDRKTALTTSGTWNLVTDHPSTARFFASKALCESAYDYTYSGSAITNFAVSPGFVSKTVYYREFGTTAPTLNLSGVTGVPSPSPLVISNAGTFLTNTISPLTPSIPHFMFGMCQVVTVSLNSPAMADTPLQIDSRLAGVPTTAIYDLGDTNCSGTGTTQRHFLVPAAATSFDIRIKAKSANNTNGSQPFVLTWSGPTVGSSSSVTFNHLVPSLLSTVAAAGVCVPVELAYMTPTSDPLDIMKFSQMTFIVSTSDTNLKFYDDASCTVSEDTTKIVTTTNGSGLTSHYLKVTAGSDPTMAINPHTPYSTDYFATSNLSVILDLP